MHMMRAFGVVLALAGGVAGWPPWANPQIYPESLGKAYYVSEFSQKITVMKGEYSMRQARRVCNAEVEEIVEVDFSPEDPKMLADPRNVIPYHNNAVREYYHTPDVMVMTLRSAEVISGADSILRLEDTEYNFNGVNRTRRIAMVFTPASRGRVRFRLRWDLEHFLDSQTDYNVILWRPLGPLWEGDDGAFISNMTFTVRLPWGTNAKANHPDPHLVPPGKGYNIFTGLRRPRPVEIWTLDSVDVVYTYDRWVSDWERRGTLGGRGYEPLKIDLLFDKQQAGCYVVPPWVYLAAVGAVVTFFAYFMSILAFLWFEMPWRTFLQKDNLADRRRLLAKIRTKRSQVSWQQPQGADTEPTDDF